MHIRTNSNRYKTFLIVFLSFTLYFNSFSQAYAANVGGWSLSNAVAQGASTVYDATKNVVINGKDFVKDSWVKITPNASQVSKVLARGGAGYALSIAVEQLIGAVDWVLDPENNRVIYYEPQDPYAIPDSPANKIWTHQCGNPIKKYESYSLNAMANWLLKQCQWDNTSISQKLVSVNTKTGDICSQNVRTHGTYYGCTSIKTRTVTVNDPPREEDRPEKSIPLDVVSQQVISNAEGGDSYAQEATTAAAADIVSDAETDNTKARPIVNQAEANAETKPADEAEAEKANNAQGQTKPNETNPEVTDIALEFPVFCSWAPTICEAAQVVISFPNTLTGWYNDTKTQAEEWAASIAESWAAAREYFEKEPEPEQEEPIQIQDPAIDISVTNYIQGNAYCPNDREIPLSMGSHTLNLVISYQPLCSVAQQFKPAVILMAFLAGAFIITNTGRRAEVGD